MSEKDAGNALPLPPARTPAAEKIVSSVTRLRQLLPPGVAANQFIVATIAEVNQLQADIDELSIFRGVLNCAVLGLVPGPALGHAYFYPFKKRGSETRICQLIPGYKGYLKLAFSTGFLTDIHPELVLVGDKFRYWIDDSGPHVEHDPNLETEPSRDTVRYAYVVYHTQSGGRGVRVVTRRELDRVDTKENVWNSDYKAMCLKTPIRRAAKEWDITPRLALAVRLDEQFDRGEIQSCELEDGILEKKNPSLSEL